MKKISEKNPWCSLRQALLLKLDRRKYCCSRCAGPCLRFKKWFKWINLEHDGNNLNEVFRRRFISFVHNFAFSKMWNGISARPSKHLHPPQVYWRLLHLCLRSKMPIMQLQYFSHNQDYDLEDTGMCSYNSSPNERCCLEAGSEGCLKCNRGLTLIDGVCTEVPILGCLQKSDDGKCINCASGTFLPIFRFCFGKWDLQTGY